MSSPEIADSVRLALVQEAASIAAAQRRSWAELSDGDLSERLLRADADAVVTGWEQAIARPPDARCRVLVAVDATSLAGFAVTTPATDGDADPQRDGAITELVVDPPARSRGHGSRLLNACVDTLRADGFGRAVMWVASTDDTLRRFLTESGWAPDGAHRELGDEDDGGFRLKQVRLHTDLSAAD